MPLIYIPIDEVRSGERCFFAMTEARARKIVASGKSPPNAWRTGDRKWGKFAVVAAPRTVDAAGLIDEHDAFAVGRAPADVERDAYRTLRAVRRALNAAMPDRPVICECCDGIGRRPLRRNEARTLAGVRREWLTTELVAENLRNSKMRIKRTTLLERLKHLEALGLVESRKVTEIRKWEKTGDARLKAWRLAAPTAPPAPAGKVER